MTLFVLAFVFAAVAGLARRSCWAASCNTTATTLTINGQPHGP
jgi:hypothetical protein